MPWYKSGTVSVVQNSNAVIGTGTAFIANARVGDAFRGPDGGWYEVTNIASDTAISISPPYLGAANSAGNYALAPMQGYVKDSADALRALVNQFGGVLAVLGNTPTQAGVRTALNLSTTDGLAEGLTNKYYSDAKVRSVILTGLLTVDSSEVTSADGLLTSIGKLQAQVRARAAKGANNDITSLSGLTAPLSAAQGGTGKTSMGAAAVGALAQSGGIPTGAIIEYVSNTNGDCIRWADGTQICTYRLNTASITMNTSYAAGLFNSPPFGGGTLPVPFKSGTVPFFPLPGIKLTFGLGWPVLSAKGSNTQWPSYFMISAVAEGGTQFDVPLIAIGRWY